MFSVNILNVVTAMNDQFSRRVRSASGLFGLVTVCASHGCQDHPMTGQTLPITSKFQSLEDENNAIVGNIGHFDNEIDMAGPEGIARIKVDNIKAQVDRYVFPTGGA